jgi:DNA uptake protein ComE-like DNA-binding protein
VGARGSAFGSPEEVVQVAGIPASVLLDVPADRAGSSAPVPGVLGLSTVFSFDPNIAPDGEPKINVSGGWSDDIKAQVAARFADQASMLEMLYATAGKLASDGELIHVLRRSKVDPGQWDDVLAILTTSDEQFARGRVDINRARVEVLAAIPGVDRPTAEKIVDARSRLSSGDREKVTWPLTQGLLTQDQFQQAYEWVSTRSVQWRVRVEARQTSGREAQKTLGSTLKADSELPDPPGIVWEAVIDVSDARPRVAYLRDVTHLPALARRALAHEQSAEAAAAANPSDSSTASAGVSDVGAELSTGGLKSNADLQLGSMKREGLKLESGLDLGSKKGGTQSEDGASPPERTESAGSGADGGSGGTPPPASKDRRIGRWRGTK